MPPTLKAGGKEAQPPDTGEVVSACAVSAPQIGVQSPFAELSAAAWVTGDSPNGPASLPSWQRHKLHLQPPYQAS